ncbi:MAG: hypothetical protein IJ683_05425 [Butyrivibrio sp.]|nr:hypothetical protein [Butyrivibrio sp.]MBR1641747.1 hypothetical protein [Butyrivibrio sp.]
MKKNKPKQVLSQADIMASKKAVLEAVSDIVARIPEFKEELSSFGLVITEQDMKNISTDGENFIFNPANVLNHYQSEGMERLVKEIMHPFFHHLRGDIDNYGATPYKDTVTAVADSEVTRAINKLFGYEDGDITQYHSDDHEMWRFNHGSKAAPADDDYDAIGEYSSVLRKRERTLVEVLLKYRGKLSISC